MYLFLALLLLLVLFGIYLKFQKSHDKKALVQTLFFVGVLLFFTYISKVIFIHKPLFILHLALVILAWFGLFLHLFKNKLHLWMIFAPTASTLFFFAIALFFREHS